MSTGATNSGWYYAKRGGPPGQQVGPINWKDLVSYSGTGALTPDDLVWNEQLGDWRSASQIPGLFSAPAAAAPAGYVAPAGYAAARPRKSNLLVWLIPLVVVILIGAGVGAYFGFWYHKGATFAQNEGEILLEASGVAGPDSFAGEQFVALGPSTTLKIPNPQVTLPQVTLPLVTTTTTGATTTSQAASTTTASTARPATVLVAYPGDTPALYGGSKSKVIADKEGELAFLEQNPKKAAAFCEALNSDPTLRWSGGNTVTPDQLRAYFAELTPMMLTRDIRVTNYGYKNGHPTPRQSVLQAGQLVLVDTYGVPRKRCECGNPLTPPKPSRKPPIYTGPQWPGFDPTTIIVIQQTTIIINNFTVIDIHTGETYVRPAGSEGGSDGTTLGGSTETTTTTISPSSNTTMTSTPPTTAGSGGSLSANELDGPWSGTMTYTEANLDDPQAQDAAALQALLDSLIGVPLPTEITITMDPGGTSGSAVMTVSMSPLSGGAGGSDYTYPLTLTYSGNELTFTEPSSEGPFVMTGTVSREGQNLVMSGVGSSSGEGASETVTWKVTKRTAL